MKQMNLKYSNALTTAIIHAKYNKNSKIKNPYKITVRRKNMYHYYVRFTALKKGPQKIHGCEEIVREKPITSVEDISQIEKQIESDIEGEGFSVIIDFYSLLRKDK